jgi:phosphoadenosine phosphosulfate reductase
MLREQTLFLFGVEDKVELAIERLRFYEPEKGYYLAYSGGKDSDTILALAKMAGVRFDAHHNLTTIDPPELVYHVRKHPEIRLERPEKPFLAKLVEKGFPLRQARWCCEHYKERGGIGRVVITGVRAEESVSRRRKMVEHCLVHPGKRYLHVIFDWTTEDVWEFLRRYEIPYCSLYDEGWVRIGCLFCPMAGAGARLREAKRYPRYVAAFLKAFRKLYARRKAGGSTAVNRWASGDEMFWWWMEDCHGPDESDQLMIFE